MVLGWLFGRKGDKPNQSGVTTASQLDFDQTNQSEKTFVTPSDFIRDLRHKREPELPKAFLQDDSFSQFPAALYKGPDGSLGPKTVTSTSFVTIQPPKRSPSPSNFNEPTVFSPPQPAQGQHTSFSPPRVEQWSPKSLPMAELRESNQNWRNQSWISDHKNVSEQDLGTIAPERQSVVHIEVKPSKKNHSFSSQTWHMDSGGRFRQDGVKVQEVHKKPTNEINDGHFSRHGHFGAMEQEIDAIKGHIDNRCEQNRENRTTGPPDSSEPRRWGQRSLDVDSQSSSGLLQVSTPLWSSQPTPKSSVGQHNYRVWPDHASDSGVVVQRSTGHGHSTISASDSEPFKFVEEEVNYIRKTRPVANIRRAWPPPSNATGVELERDALLPPSGRSRQNRRALSQQPFSPTLKQTTPKLIPRPQLQPIRQEQGRQLTADNIVNELRSNLTVITSDLEGQTAALEREAAELEQAHPVAAPRRSRPTASSSQAIPLPRVSLSVSPRHALSIDTRPSFRSAVLNSTPRPFSPNIFTRSYRNDVMSRDAMSRDLMSKSEYLPRKTTASPFSPVRQHEAYTDHNLHNFSDF